MGRFEVEKKSSRAMRVKGNYDSAIENFRFSSIWWKHGFKDGASGEKTEMAVDLGIFFHGRGLRFSHSGGTCLLMRD